MIIISVIIAIVISDDELLKKHFPQQVRETTDYQGNTTDLPSSNSAENPTRQKQITDANQNNVQGVRLLPPEKRQLARSNYRKLSGVYFSRKQMLKERIKGFRNLSQEKRQEILQNRKKNMIIEYNSEQEAHNTGSI
jgi:hypothetical protein